MSEKHHDFLKNHCRVCGKRLGRTNYICEKFSSILTSLGVNNLRSTDDTIHPPSFCNLCYSKCKGGRHKKISSGGRPSLLQAHIQYVSTDLVHQFKLSQIMDNTCMKYIRCASCQYEVNRPVEILPCKTRMCYSCCLDVIAESHFDCKGCPDKHVVTTGTFSQLSPMAEKTINDMHVK